MHYTEYGRTLICDEPQFTDPTGLGGASAHVAIRSYDTGIDVLMTGTDASGRRFTSRARSAQGAWATMRAAWGLRRAWHIRDDGTRRLIMSR